MKKKNIVVTVAAVIILIIGVVIVKMNTDKRKAEVEASKSQTEKDAEALDNRINNPESAEDYYEAFLAGKISASTKKSDVTIFGRHKTISFEEMYDELIKLTGSNAWPSKLMMCSYCLFTPKNQDIPDLIIRFHFGFSYNEETYDQICVIRYIGDGNLRMICEVSAPNVKSGKQDLVSSIKVLSNGIIEESIQYNHLHGIRVSTYYNLCTGDKEADCIADIKEYCGLDSCVIPVKDLPKEIVDEDYVEAIFRGAINGEIGGYKLQVINMDYLQRKNTAEFYQENVFYIFSNADGDVIYPEDSEYISLYEQYKLNILNSDKANAFMKNLFEDSGYDYDTCFDAPEVTWIDIQCPPWGPYN